MVNVCIDPLNFRVGTGGVLDIRAVAGRVLRQSTTTNSSGDGTFTTTPRPLPGTNHIDTTFSWLNNTGAPLKVMVEIYRPRRDVLASQPNLVFVRDRATVSVGGTPDTPDVTNV